jgi:peptidyl-prolyl cis-trans isomerase A (cyclophilin A)
MIRMTGLWTLIALFLYSNISAQEPVRCVIVTELGNITVALYPERAPITVSNFLYYVDSGSYVNSSFFRVCTPENEAERDVKIEVVQGGNIKEDHAKEPIVIETTETTGIRHLDGTISMARAGPNTATSSFFICVGEQPELDFGGKRNPDGFGFAAFGIVQEGMDVVRNIQSGANKGQYLESPVTILEIKRL